MHLWSGHFPGCIWRNGSNMHLHIRIVRVSSEKREEREGDSESSIPMTARWIHNAIYHKSRSGDGLKQKIWTVELSNRRNLKEAFR